MNESSHEAIPQLFSRLVEQDILGHAYLFVGPQSVHVDEVISSCVQALKGASPLEEIPLTYDPEEEKMLLDQMKELLRTLSLSGSNEHGRSLVRIPQVDRMSPAVANAFLKNLEEPRKGVIFFLSASSLRGVLPTIASRCQIIRVPYVFSPEEATEAITSHADWFRFCQKASWVQLEEAILSALHAKPENNATLTEVMDHYIQARKADRLSVKHEYVRDIIATRCPFV